MATIKGFPDIQIETEREIGSSSVYLTLKQINAEGEQNEVRFPLSYRQVVIAQMRAAADMSITSE